MADITVSNWFGDIVAKPRVVVEATSTEDVVRILTDPVNCPSTGGSKIRCYQRRVRGRGVDGTWGSRGQDSGDDLIVFK